MNWDRIEGQWKLLTGHAKERWGHLTDDDMDVIAGRRDQLAGKLQERYGLLKDEAEKQVSEWQDRVSEAWFGSATASPRHGKPARHDPPGKA